MNKDMVAVLANANVPDQMMKGRSPPGKLRGRLPDTEPQ
jgi:hypothetical protein